MNNGLGVFVVIFVIFFCVVFSLIALYGAAILAFLGGILAAVWYFISHLFASAAFLLLA